jgi:hypothetical protein
MILPDDPYTVRVPLRGRDGVPRAWALIDVADAPRLREHRWRLDSHGYAIAHMRVDGIVRTVLMHRFIIDAPPGTCVDHRNRQRLDNRRRNLRLVTHGENMMNVGANRGSTSAYCGVSWHSHRRKWVAAFRGRYLGCFADELEAAHCAALARGETGVANP